MKTASFWKCCLKRSLFKIIQFRVPCTWSNRVVFKTIIYWCHVWRKESRENLAVKNHHWSKWWTCIEKCSACYCRNDFSLRSSFSISARLAILSKNGGAARHLNSRTTSIPQTGATVFQLTYERSRATANSILTLFCWSFCPCTHSTRTQ